MRITAEAKARTRERIDEAALGLFGSEAGFEGTTTRDIAAQAGIAAGTLFNYFPSKEALAAEIVEQAAEVGERDFATDSEPDDLAEALFAHVMAVLRRLEPHRRWLPAVLERCAAPAAGPASGPDATVFGRTHMDVVSRLLAAHAGRPPTTVTLNLYWTLYIGVLAFWSRDESDGQQQTLALLDQSVRMFAADRP